MRQLVTGTISILAELLALARLVWARRWHVSGQGSTGVTIQHALGLARAVFDLLLAWKGNPPA